MIIRFMRTILFFDLPAVTKTDHREYTHFVKSIRKCGFDMMQESVYTKLSINPAVAEKTIAEVKKMLPRDGMVSVLTLTEKEFSSIEHLLGEMKTDLIVNEEKVIKL